jgi:hypothetical protein
VKNHFVQTVQVVQIVQAVLEVENRESLARPFVVPHESVL